MKENSIEKDIKQVESLIKKCDGCKLNECINCEINWTEIQSIKNIIRALHKANKDKHNQSNLRRLNDRKYRKVLSDYKRVLKENEKQKELIERMKSFLLKENKMCQFLESE